MPAVFDKLGIRFMYPDNWTLDESDAVAGEQSVTVYSPGGSFWSVRLHASEVDPSDLVDAALATIRTEYQEVDAETFHKTHGDYQIVGCEMNFYYLDLTNTAIVQGFRTSQSTLLILCQADDREFAQIGRIFEAMTISLLENRP